MMFSLLETMIPNLTMAKVDVGTPPNENFLKYLSSVMFLHLHWVDETVSYIGIHLSVLWSH